jgi:hypothetical protein
VASLGLLKAIDRYDPERGRNFISCATPTIVGEQEIGDRVGYSQMLAALLGQVVDDA